MLVETTARETLFFDEAARLDDEAAFEDEVIFVKDEVAFFLIHKVVVVIEMTAIGAALPGFLSLAALISMDMRRTACKKLLANG